MYKAIAIKVLASKLGWLLKLVTGLIAGIVLPFIVNTLGITLPPENQAEVTAAIAGAVYILMQTIILKISLDGNAKIQEELQKINPRVNKDRWIGDVTIGALEDAVRQSTDATKLKDEYDGIPRAVILRKPKAYKGGAE